MGDNPTGTTPLPTSSAGSPVRVWFDVESVASEAQQPQTQQIANFDAKANEDCINGSTVAVNQHFVVYTVKNGLIRVLHRHSTLRTLLRAHQDERVTDIRFFQDGDVLATVGSNTERSTIVIWRIYERQPEVMAEKLLEISSVKSTISRVLWHPFNPNQFWMIHTNMAGTQMATLVETTKIRTHPHENHAACDFYRDHIIMEHAITIQSSNGEDINDLAWSPRDSRHILTAHSSGDVCLWDVKQLTPRGGGDGTLAPALVERVRTERPVTRCLFLPHDDRVRDDGGGGRTLNAITSCFVTASDQNATITLWSPFFDHHGAAPPTPIQVLSLERPSPSYIVNVVHGITPPDASPLSSFLVMADRHAGNILAFHLRAQWEDVGPKAVKKKTFLVGADYVVPFQTRYPVFSWSVQCAPSTDITEEELVDQGGLIFDTKLFAYQSKLVQCLTLTSYMCLPPEITYVDPTPGVRFQRLKQVHSAHISVVEENEDTPDIQYDEDYDYDGENDDDEEGEEDDEDAVLHPVLDTNLSNNPFANWLGAIAAKSSADAVADATAPPPLPPMPVVPNTIKPTPPPHTPVMAPIESNGYAVPIVTAPPASSLPAPEGEPLAFLSPSDFVAHTSSPRASSEPTGDGKHPQQQQQQQQHQDLKKTANVKPKKGKKNTPVRNRNEMNLTILRRDTTPVPETRTVSAAAAAAPAVAALPLAVDIAAEIRQAVKEEMKNTVLPAIKSTIKESLNASIVKPLQVSIDKIIQNGVTVDYDKVSAYLASSVDQPLRLAFADSMKLVFIPTLESVTGQILEKLSENLASSAAENGSAGKEIAAMSSQLSTMTELVAELTREVQALRDAANSRQSAAPAAPPIPTGVEAVKAEIRRLLSEKHFEAAFTKAVSASTAELAVFCCANADLTEVLAMTKIQLSQPIILCLMQQLGTVIATGRNTNLAVEMEWLQDLALSLDPKNAQIHQHVPRVLHQLATSINTRMAEADPNLRRPLQRLLQIIRGIPVS